MEIRETAIAGVRLLTPTRHRDARGFFSEVYREDLLAAHGIAVRFVQENHSLSRARGTVRGLHFQIPPFAQAKLVRVTAGAILDVAVDLRHGSPSFGRHVTARLSAAEWNQIFVPEGFAHGFCTLEPDTEVVYKVNRPYSAAHDRGLYWNDPALAIPWPVGEVEALLSERDRQHPPLAALPQFFGYEAEGAAALHPGPLPVIPGSSPGREREGPAARGPREGEGERCRPCPIPTPLREGGEVG